METLTNYLLLLTFGFALSFFLAAWRKKLLFTFPFFLIAASVSTFGTHFISLVPSMTHNPSTPTLIIFITNCIKGINMISQVTLGYCLGQLLAWFLPPVKDSNPSIRYRYTTYISRGLSIQIGLSFIGFSIGKLLNLAIMKDFFSISGYSISFLYVIIIIESLFGLLLLFNLKFYIRILSITILSAVICGALITHIRNGDPLSDSEDAILLGIKLMILTSVYLLNKQKSPGNRGTLSDSLNQKGA